MQVLSPSVSNNTSIPRENTSPLANELTPLFEAIPIPLLLAALKSYYAGRKGYDKEVMLRTIISMYYLGIPSFAALIRVLQGNPLLRRICGIERWTEIPSRQAYSRFVTKLAHASGMVQRIVGLMTEKLGGAIPGLGEVVAIDSTDIKAFSNGNPKGKQHQISDPDAGWIVKKRPNGKTGSTFGYKVHLICDTTHEVPLAVNVTKGNVWDGHHALPLLSQARHVWHDFTPTVVLADAGYSWNVLRDTITDQWHALPLIGMICSRFRIVGSSIGAVSG